MPPKKRGSVRNRLTRRRHHANPQRAAAAQAAAAAARDAAAGGGGAAGGGATANTNPVPSPAAATPAPARAQAPHATAEGGDGVIAMDVGDAGEGGGSVVNAASRRTRTGLGPVEATDEEYSVLGKDWVRAVRPTIAGAYVNVFKAPPKGDWHGRDGVIAAIRKSVSVTVGHELPYRMVEEVIEQVYACYLAGEVWTDPGRAHGGGAVLSIEPGSTYETKVLRWLEDGCSYRDTRDYVNALLQRDKRETVCETAVISCMMRCSPRYTSVHFVSQANRDPECNWALVRHRQMAQLSIRLSLWDPTLAELKADGLVKATATSIPACFDKSKLEAVGHARIGFWDQTHKSSPHRAGEGEERQTKHGCPVPARPGDRRVLAQGAGRRVPGCADGDGLQVRSGVPALLRRASERQDGDLVVQREDHPRHQEVGRGGSGRDEIGPRPARRSQGHGEVEGRAPSCWQGPTLSGGH